MKRVRWAGIAAVVGLLVGCGGSESVGDKYLWLEELHSARVDTWVELENRKTLGVLESDPRFAENLGQAKSIGGAADRITTPVIYAGAVFNFWQDARHRRGIWRTTSVASFESPAPAWTTVVDLDELATREGKNWVWQGVNCESTSETRCLIQLSDGGEDAAVYREFDTITRQFVTGGFELPKGKQSAQWVDEDTLVVAREWVPGELTSSGYPFVAKTVRRGQPLAAATEVGRGAKTDVGTEVLAFVGGDGRRAALVDRGLTFWEHEFRLLTPTGSPVVALPRKSEAQGLVAGQLLVKLNEPWQVFPAGALVAVDLTAAQRDPAHPQAALVYAPGPRETLGEIGTTRDRVVLTTYQNVRGRVTVLTPGPGGTWIGRPIPIPDHSTIDITTTDSHGTVAYLTVTSFLTPTALWRLDTNTAASVVKSMEPKFDASRLLVEQQEAASPDGTMVPYFVVRPTNLPFNGATPTILNAYGGFASSKTPSYNGALGKLWLERGGVYVVANIRGGGEFGPSWHEAALTVNRQRAFDDFAAVARDLAARKITDARHLGIQGGSNGGLLMGVSMTQHPELYNAVDIQVPLLDMLRYEQIAAGPSWVGEYGSVNDPAQRAFLASISPYHQLKSGVRYPQPLVWTTTKDDRVGPQHARKFAATLSEQGHPYFFFEATQGGHGAGANIDEKSFTAALEYTYFQRALM